MIIDSKYYPKESGLITFSYTLNNYNYYYQYKDSLPNNSFIQWFMKGIGRYKVNIPDIDRKECDLVPEYGYYSECGSIYNDYYKMSLIINNYESW